MAQGYEFFEHTADIGVNVYGATLEELFSNAAAAMYEALGRLQKTVDSRQRTVQIEAPTLEDLLHDWLAELLYEIEANHVLYDDIASLIIRGSAVPGATGPGNRGGDAAPTLELSARLNGGTIDFARSQTNEEIKAVTYHHLRVEQTPAGIWRATVIFDV